MFQNLLSTPKIAILFLRKLPLWALAVPDLDIIGAVAVFNILCKESASAELKKKREDKSTWPVFPNR
jgi:hypothetical protein